MVVVALLVIFFFPKRYYRADVENVNYSWEIYECFGIRHNKIFGNTEREKPVCFGLLYGKKCYLTPGRSSLTEC